MQGPNPAAEHSRERGVKLPRKLSQGLHHPGQLRKSWYFFFFF